MKKYIVRILAVIGAAVAVILIIAATKPDTFRVERTITMKAPPERIAVQINNFHNWKAWSPFEKMDPEMKRSFAGSSFGVGAVYAWAGNSRAGSGRMEITDTLHSTITIKLDFIKPFEGHNTAQFRMVPDGESTRVTWAMYGPNQFLGKIMSIFFNMDRLLGQEFEEGLTRMKSTVEL